MAGWAITGVVMAGDSAQEDADGQDGGGGGAVAGGGTAGSGWFLKSTRLRQRWGITIGSDWEPAFKFPDCRCLTLDLTGAHDASAQRARMGCTCASVLKDLLCGFAFTEFADALRQRIKVFKQKVHELNYVPRVLCGCSRLIRLRVIPLMWGGALHRH